MIVPAGQAILGSTLSRRCFDIRQNHIPADVVPHSNGNVTSSQPPACLDSGLEVARSVLTRAVEVGVVRNTGLHARLEQPLGQPQR